MVEIVPIEPGERLRLELLQRQRLRRTEGPVDQLSDPFTSAELLTCLLRFLARHDTVVIEVKAPEHAVRLRLRLGPRHVLHRAAALILGEHLRRNNCRAERDRHKQSLHAC
jgi:hypothetical protein